MAPRKAPSNPWEPSISLQDRSLGNFAPFADLEIRTGHDPSAADDYHRALDISTGVGSVRYTVGDVTYSREYFCSYPQDLFVARFTAEGGKMDLVLEARTAHKKNTIESKGREIHLRGSASMDRDDMEFMQAVRVVAGDAKVEAKADGTLHISGATEVISIGRRLYGLLARISGIQRTRF